MKKLILMWLAGLVMVLFLVSSCSGPIAGQAIGDKCTKDSQCGVGKRCDMKSWKCVSATTTPTTVATKITTETVCNDGKDDDGDGNIDCADSNCNCCYDSDVNSKDPYLTLGYVIDESNTKGEWDSCNAKTLLNEKTCEDNKLKNVLKKCNEYGKEYTCQKSGDGAKCVAPTVTEKVKCVFKDSTKEEICQSSDKVYSCKGAETCVIDVSDVKGKEIKWETSCGGVFKAAFTTIDDIDKSVEFDCKVPSCDAQHLGLCKTQETCTPVGYWYALKSVCVDVCYYDSEADVNKVCKLKETVTETVTNTTTTTGTKNLPPNKPSLVFPTDNEKVTLPVTLKWNDKGDSDNSPNTVRNYHWYIKNVDGKTVWERTWTNADGGENDCSPLSTQQGTWTCQSAKVPNGKLQVGQTYTWAVEAGDGALPSGYSKEWKFVSS